MRCPPCGSGGTGIRARLRILRFPRFKLTHLCSSLHAVYQRGESRFLKLALFCSLLLIVGLQISYSAASAQEKPDAPKPKPACERSHKVFYAGISMLAAAETA